MAAEDEPSSRSLIQLAARLTRSTPRDAEAWIMLGHAEDAAVWGAEAMEHFPLWPWVMRDPNVVQHIRHNRGEDVPMVAPEGMNLSFVRHEDFLTEPMMSIEENRVVIKTQPKNEVDQKLPHYFLHRAWVQDLETGFLALQVRANSDYNALTGEDLDHLRSAEKAYANALRLGVNDAQLDLIGHAALRSIAIQCFVLRKAMLPKELAQWNDIPPPALRTADWESDLANSMIEHPDVPQAWRVRLLFAFAAEPFFPAMAARWNDGNVVDELDELFDEGDPPAFLDDLVMERCTDLAREALVLLVEETAESVEDYSFPIPTALDVPVPRLTARARELLAERPGAVNFATTMIWRLANVLSDEEALPWQLVASRIQDATARRAPRSYSKDRADHEWQQQGDAQIEPRVKSPVYIRWDKPDEWPAKADELNVLLDFLAPFE